MTPPKLGKVDQLIAARVASAVIAAKSATIKTFLAVLSSKLTQQDKKEYARETARGGNGNIYRLGLLFEALSKVEDAVRPYLDKDDEEAMEALKKAIQKNFHADYPPVKNVLKQIDAWVTKKKYPSIVAN